VNFSVDASPVGFWKQVEPYFAYMIPADIDHLHQLTKEFEVDDTALQIPLCSDQLLKVQCSFDSFFCVLINFDCLVLLSA
jgi:hypothetical protein